MLRGENIENIAHNDNSQSFEAPFDLNEAGNDDSNDYEAGFDYSEDSGGIFESDSEAGFSVEESSEVGSNYEIGDDE